MAATQHARTQRDALASRQYLHTPATGSLAQLAPAPPPPPTLWAEDSATWPRWPSGHLFPNVQTPRRQELCGHGCAL